MSYFLDCVSVVVFLVSKYSVIIDMELCNDGYVGFAIKALKAVENLCMFKLHVINSDIMVCFLGVKL